MKYILAVDIGTTNAKVASYTFDGKQVTFVTAAYGQTDITLQDANVILETTLCLLTQTLNELTQKDAVREIAKLVFSSAMHSVLFLDEKFNPLSPVYTWANNYGQEFLATLKQLSMVQARYFKTGTPLHPMAPFVKLYGFKQKQPELLQKSAYVVGIKEYLLWHLTGQLKMDLGIATATGLVIDKQWDAALLECVGLKKTQMPPLAVPTYQAKITAKMAQKLGLAPTTQIVWGSSDGALANLGVSQVDELVLTFGTSAAIRVLTKQPCYHQNNSLFCYIAKEHQWIVGGPSNNAGNVLAWFRQTYGLEDLSFAEMLALIAESPIGAEGLLFLPYLYGERAPLWDAQVSAQFFNVKATHTRPMLLRAVVEGLFMNFASIISLLEQQLGQNFAKIKVTGKIFQTPCCAQMLADILGKQVEVLPKQEASCLGAFKLVKGQIKNPQVQLISYKPTILAYKKYQGILINFKEKQKFVSHGTFFKNS